MIGEPRRRAGAATDSEVANKLFGAWRYVGTRINGDDWDRGANPKGMIYYGAHGDMAVQIAPDVKRTRAGAVMSPQEAFTAVKDYIAYFGTYTVDEKAGTVTHHRLDSIQCGTTAIRSHRRVRCLSVEAELGAGVCQVTFLGGVVSV